ncbi:MAG: sialidase family protein [Bacteroidota bacterium]
MSLKQLCLFFLLIVGSKAFAQSASKQKDTSLFNLAEKATVSSPYAQKFPQRKITNLIDGKSDNNPNNGWTPNISNVNSKNPVLIALSWEKPVRIEQIDLSWLKNWYFTDYTFATWNGPEPVILTAPPTRYKHTNVFTSGQEGYHTFRIPAMVISPKGTIFAFCEGRKNNNRDVGAIDLLVKRSTDQGATWGAAQVVYGEKSEVTIGNPVPIADKTGNIHVVFCKDSKSVLYSKSNDDGLTYSSPADITNAIDELCKNAGLQWDQVWTGPGHGLETSKGRLIIPLKVTRKETEGIKRRVGIIYSDDGGNTWLPGGIVTPSIGEMSECSVFEKADGTLLINMRWHDGRYRAVSESANGGLTWSVPIAAKQLPDPGSEGSIIRYSSDKDDQRVLFSNLNNQEVGTVNRKNLTLRLSKDDGKTWNSGLQIVPGPAGYSDIAITKKGKVAILFENGTASYSDQLTFCLIDPNELELPKKGALTKESYEVNVARSFIQNKNWNLIEKISNNEAKPKIYTLKKPIVTNTLFISVSGTHQPDGLAYFQEIRVLGHENNDEKK